MQYDIIFISGEIYFDHPLSGIAILKRLLEKKGYKVGVIEMPKSEHDITKLGKPKLFFGVSSGSIDSMVRNYTPLKKLRINDKNLNYNEEVPDRAVTVYCNWIKKKFKNSKIVIGGTEATLRRFTHYDYMQNRLRKPILFDSRADILVYGNAEKQIVEIANKIKNNKELTNIKGTCIISKELPSKIALLPSYNEIKNDNLKSKTAFCKMQNLLTNTKDLAQKIDNRYLIQYKSPIYTSKDLDEYYGLKFTRKIPPQYKHLRGFEFSVVTHRGCVGECSFCAIDLIQGKKIISRSEKSILDEIKYITTLPNFKGNIDDLGGPSANMYGMDCIYSDFCNNSCLNCNNFNSSNAPLIKLLTKSRKIKGVKRIYIRSGIRYDLASDEYLIELIKHHIFDTLRIAPEHINKKILNLMNKNKGDLNSFIKRFNKIKKELKSYKELSYYFMTAHPGSSIKEAQELSNFVKNLKNAKSIQIFTPTPMTISTCMYYTSLNPKNLKKIYVPYSYNEKKNQKRIIMKNLK